MDLVHHLTLLTLKYNIYIRVEHIADKKNKIVDALSRFQFERFRSLAILMQTQGHARSEYRYSKLPWTIIFHFF